MDRPFPLRFELPGHVKQLRVKRIDESFIDILQKSMNAPPPKRPKCYWRLWLMANKDFSLGTFIQLLDNGEINRITWHEDGSETVFPIKSD